MISEDSLEYRNYELSLIQGELMIKGKTLVVLALVSAMAFASIPMVAQAAQSAPAAGSPPKANLDQEIQMLRRDVRSAKKEITAANMNLTTDEATKFWPIYDQYAAEVAKISDSRVELIKEYAATYSTMTDAQANDFMERAGSIDQQFMATRLKYASIFEKAISAKKAALWYQIDRRLDLMINLQLASNIPVVATTK